MVATGMELDYKELVVEMMERANSGKSGGANLTMLELRLTLFVAACRNENHDRCLLPFPPCFFNAETKTKDFTGLDEQIQQLPDLDTLNEETSLPGLTWKLLYWVFTNPLTISPLFNTDMTLSAELKEMIELKTSLVLPCGGTSCFIFEVNTPNPKPRFVDGKASHGSYFAFHGSQICNFHSIIHRGLLGALNQRSALGPGTYLTSLYTVSQSYSALGTGWEKSMFGRRLKCIGICEVVNAPEGLKKHPYGGGSSVTVVTDDDLVQLTYLLLFTPEFYCTPKNLQMLRNKFQ